MHFKFVKNTANLKLPLKQDDPSYVIVLQDKINNEDVLHTCLFPNQSTKYQAKNKIRVIIFHFFSPSTSSILFSSLVFKCSCSSFFFFFFSSFSFYLRNTHYSVFNFIFSNMTLSAIALLLKLSFTLLFLQPQSTITVVAAEGCIDPLEEITIIRLLHSYVIKL